MAHLDKPASPSLDLPYSLADLTLIVGVHLHDANPWVLDRLELIARHYRPLPAVLVVDLGSREPQAKQIESVARKHGFRYLPVADPGPYCPARAKNVGAAHASTPLLFFCDIDCFGPANLFARLIEAANELSMQATLDQLLSLPVYHLTQAASERITRAQDSGLALSRSLARAVYTARGEEADFVAPYSNCFLCRRDYYDLVGGQNERFRGHGSEDFEFLLRVAVFNRQLPLPERPAANLFGPLHSGHFGPRPYRGFRRLLELMATQAELLGLRVAHLDHPRPKAGQAWHRLHEKKRSAFSIESAPYLRDAAALIDYDFMPKSQRALAFYGDVREADLLTTLRTRGYQLIGIDVREPSHEAKALELLRRGKIDALAAVSGASQRALSQVTARASWQGLQIIFTPAQEPATFVATSATDEPFSTLRVEVTDLPSGPLWRDGRRIVRAVDDARWTRACLDQELSWDAYASARAGIGDELRRQMGSDLPLVLRRFRKLVRNPRRFLLDSRIGFLSKLGER